MRTTLLTSVCAAALLATGCGGNDEPNLSGDVEKMQDAVAAMSDCSDVWSAGATLPEDYEGCLNGDTVDVPIYLECSDGSRFTSYQDTYYAFLGDEVGVAKSEGDAANDPGYKRAYEKCMG